MKLLIDYNIEIVKLLKAEQYTKEEVLLILEQALRNVDGLRVITEQQLKEYKDLYVLKR
jgi:predicted nucleic acid-binding protein